MKNLMDLMRFNADDLSANQESRITAEQHKTISDYFDAYARRFNTARTLILIGVVIGLLLGCFYVFAPHLVQRIPEKQRPLFLLLGIALGCVPVAITIFHRLKTRARIVSLRPKDIHSSQVQSCTGLIRTGWFGPAGRAVFNFRVGTENLALHFDPPQEIERYFDSKTRYRVYYVDSPHLPLVLSLEPSNT